MPGSDIAGPPLDPRRRRLLVRAWRRGLRELDLLFGGYADQHAPTMGEDELREFERLLEEPDALMLAWVTGAEAPPPPINTPLFRAIRDFRAKGLKGSP